LKALAIEKRNDRVLKRGLILEDTKIQSYSKSRLQQGNRPLGELLPLETPLSIMIDPSNTCNFKCIFCPTGDAELLDQVKRPKGIMSLDLFQKLIDDLAIFPEQVNVLHLYKDGEPLINKSLPDMIAYAKASNRVGRVEITTNASLFNPERSSALITAGLDGIRISVYALDDAGYSKTTKSMATFARIRSNIAAMYTQKCIERPELKIHCKIVDVGLSDDEKEQFSKEFSPISDSFHIDSIMGWSSTPNRDLTLGVSSNFGMTGEERISSRKACSEPFMKLVVNFNGLVSVCCVDWALETIVGDARTESLFDIWNGDKLKKFRLKHLLGQRDTLSACSSCDYIQGLPHQSYFDHKLDQLLPLYLGNKAKA
jgi:MoaA/NifB/PqqE/SkfB family radical SAM enzyme